MKKLFYFASLACMMMFAACSSDNDEIVEESQKGEMITVNVGMPGADSRVDFAGNKITNMVWAAGDKITVVGYDYKGWPRGKVSKGFESQDYIGKTSAKFVFQQMTTGKADEPFCSNYRFLYIGSKVTFDHQTPWKAFSEGTADCGYLAQVQNKVDKSVNNPANEFEHVKDHLYMTSGVKPLVDNKVEASVLVLNNSVLKLNVPNLPKALEGAKSYEVKFFVNYDKDAAEIAKLTFNGALEATDTLYLAFDPANDLTAGKNIGFEITANDKTFKTSQVSTNGKNYEAGKIYTVTTTGWTWDEVVVSNTGSYNVVFDAANKFADWHVEGYLTSDAVTLSNIYNTNCMQILAPKKESTQADGYVVSPARTLGANSNKVSFEHIANTSFYWYEVQPSSALGFAIRKAGTKTWTDLGLSLFPNNWGSSDVFDLSAWKGENVEFGFKYTGHDTWKNGGQWGIKSFSLVCE